MLKLKKWEDMSRLEKRYVVFVIGCWLYAAIVWIHVFIGWAKIKKTNEEIKRVSDSLDEEW